MTSLIRITRFTGERIVIVKRNGGLFTAHCWDYPDLFAEKNQLRMFRDSRRSI